MTTTKMIENVYKMLDDAIRVANPGTAEAEKNIRRMLTEPGFAFGDTLEALQADLRREAAKKTGKHNQTAAAGRIIKTGKKTSGRPELLSGAWTGADGMQYVCSGYVMVRYVEPLPLPEAAGMPGLERNIADTAQSGGQPLDLPSIGDIKAAIAAHKAQVANVPARHRPACQWDFGEDLPAVNAQYLIDVMEALPGAAATWTKPTSPIYFTDGINEGILLPIRKAATRSEYVEVSA